MDRTRALLREDRRLIVNALKMAAANAERMLARLFDQSYQRPQDAFSVFRALLQLPGQFTPTAPDRLEVRLHRPDSEKVARALRNVLGDLNHESPRTTDGRTNAVQSRAEHLRWGSWLRSNRTLRCGCVPVHVALRVGAASDEHGGAPFGALRGYSSRPSACNQNR